MLVLTRRKNQKLNIGKDIVLTIVRIEGNQVRIGIECPSHVNIKRAELDNLLPEEIEHAATLAKESARLAREKAEALAPPTDGKTVAGESIGSCSDSVPKGKPGE